IKPNDKTKYLFSELDDEKHKKAFKRAYTFDIRTRACDTARIMLPAATLTNVAMVANGRVFEHLLKRMYSSRHPEFKDIANRLHDTLNKVIPKYVKRANPEGEEFWQKTDEAIRENLQKYLPSCASWGGDTEAVKLHNVPRLLDNNRRSVYHLLAAVYFPYARVDYESLVQSFASLPYEQVLSMLSDAVGARSVRRDRSPRGFEHGYDITVEIVADFGVFRDLHRHRMCTLQWQRPNPHLGFEVPADIEKIGMKEACLAVEKEVRELYDDLEKELGDQFAEYVTLFGHKIRFMIGMNLREAQHMLELRSVAQGHPNYRHIAQRIHNLIIEKAPWLAKTDLFKFVDHNEYDWARADAEARQSQKALEKGLEI
ncbi:hypothetical protein D6827_03235, partial [Candidatus Parcubacteria bacterium]